MSFAIWVSDLMEHFGVDQSAFIGPSYGAGIILRLATYRPERIACAVLVSPSGLQLGLKVKMMQKILMPMIMYKMSSSNRQLQKIADVMSAGSMQPRDKHIIGDIFKHVKLEQEMPKLTERNELIHYTAPTLVIGGEQDIFFPVDQVLATAREIVSKALLLSYEMGHFPASESCAKINEAIKQFLQHNYASFT